MKNAFTKIAVLAVMVSSLGGCAMATGGNASAIGTIYMSVKTPGAVGNGPAAKSGEACISSILGVIATGDASIAAAKAAGGISQVSHVDHEVTDILGLYAKSCTVVYGQ